MPTSPRVSLAACFAWTSFVWLGRIRNALTDDALSGSERVGPLLLSASFLVPTVVLVAAWAAARRGRGSRALLVHGTRALAAWTVGVWLLRAGDIVLGGDHEVGFVVVHVVLAVVSSLLALVAAYAAPIVAGEPGRSRDPGHAAAPTP